MCRLRLRRRHKHSSTTLSSFPLYILCVCMWSWSPSVTVMVYGLKHTILMRDVEFVGEDPVLMGELRRRMPVVPDLDLDLDLQLGDLERGHRTTNTTTTPWTRSPRSDTNNQTNIARRAEDRKYKAYINEPGDEMVKNLAVQMIEQAIYSVEYRLKESAHYVGKYDKDVRYRMGYIFKQLERWIYEMEMMYTYISNDVRNQKDEYNLRKNFIYYSHLVRKNFDITYTIYHLLKIHTEFYSQVLAKKKAGSRKPVTGPTIDHRDVDPKDPDLIQFVEGFTNNNDEYIT